MTPQERDLFNRMAKRLEQLESRMEDVEEEVPHAPQTLKEKLEARRQESKNAEAGPDFAAKLRRDGIPSDIIPGQNRNQAPFRKR